MVATSHAARLSNDAPAARVSGWVSGKGALGLPVPLRLAPHVSAMTAVSDAMSGKVAGQAAYASRARALMLAGGRQAVAAVDVVSPRVASREGQDAQTGFVYRVRVS
jgi:hypothetical protein